ncbi:MAG: FixG Ig-like domain-containing protein, partial [Myxococcota bacterium]
MLRPRVLTYASFLAVVTVVFVAALAARVPIGLRVLHNAESLVTRAADGRISNAFTLRVENRDRIERSLLLRLDDSLFDLVAGVNPMVLAPTSSVEARVFVMAPPEWEPTRTELRFVLERTDDPSTRVVDDTFFLVTGAHRGG